MEEVTLCCCETATELVITIRTSKSNGRTTALRVKVCRIEKKKNAGADFGEERYEYLTEIDGEYNA